MKLKILLFSAILFSTLFACHRASDQDVHRAIGENTDTIFANLVDIRRDIHQHPELSGDEQRTSQIIEKYLTDLGLEVMTGLAGHGVVGILRGGKAGKRIAWRADMDAIRNDNTDQEVFKSLNDGVGHMCGHDVHATIGLGIANVLSKLKDHLSGTVYFVFQPAEETFLGAKAMVDEGLFRKIHPDEIYGLHIFPTESGVVNLKANELFAYEKTVKLKFASVADPTALRAFFKQIMEGFRRQRPEATPWSLDFLTDTVFGLENPATMYQDYFILIPNIYLTEGENGLSLNATFFETDSNRLDSILIEIKSQILNSDYREAFVSIEYSRGNPTVLNSPELTAISQRLLDSLYHGGIVQPLYGQVPYFNEDFIYFQQKVPGVMFLLGGSNAEKGIMAMPHTPDFRVDEEAIKYGVKYFSSLILERVNQ